MLPWKEENDPGAILSQLHEVRPGSVRRVTVMHRQGTYRSQLARLRRIAAAAGVPLIASNYALYATPEQRPLHDVVTCIREGVTVASAGRLLAANAERYLKSPQEMTQLFRD